MSPEPLTIAEALRLSAEYLHEHGVGSARLDAELLLSRVLGLSRLDLYLAFDRPLSDDERGRMRALLARRGRREPLAHITGEREFFSRVFEVSPDVLIPRPETERLVERLLERERGGDLPPGPILDVGTGSGAIAVTLACEMPKRSLVATDISAAALAVVRRNAERHGVADRVALHEADLAKGMAGPFAAIVSNPPYVAESERAILTPEVLREPERALFGGANGLAVIRRLVEEAPPLLSPAGVLLIEVGAGQAGEVMRMIRDRGECEAVAALTDLAGIERVVEATRRVARVSSKS
ncbi:peptide chain release factor N(5)-glutamine methyltransferase [Candidatus Sumerlaeota bacterium]|nr:peptide chain release factor N(5)-glutamine methyltransferase [Candidatus Sumerlaeota bacterium]